MCCERKKENSAMSTYMITHLSTIDECISPRECYWGLNLPGEGKIWEAVAKILSYLLKQIKKINTDNKIKKTFLF